MVMKLTDLDKQIGEKRYNLNLPKINTGLEDIRPILDQSQVMPQTEEVVMPEVVPAAPSLDDYKTLLDRAKQNQVGSNLIANLGQIGTEYSSRMAGYKPDTSIYEGMRQQSALDTKGAESDVTRAEENAAKLERAKELAQRTLTIKQAEMEQRATEGEKNRKANEDLVKYRAAEAANRAKESNDLKLILAGMVQSNKDRPSEKFTSQAADTNSLLTNLERIDQLHSNMDQGFLEGTGFLAGRYQAAKGSMFDKASPEFNELAQLTGDNLALYVRSISGAAVSEAEAQRLLKLVPNVNMGPEKFKTSLNAFRNRLKTAMDAQLNAMKSTGRNVEGFKSALSKVGGQTQSTNKSSKQAELDAINKELESLKSGG